MFLDEVDTRFVKLLSASIEHVQNLIDEERKAIMEQMAEESSDEVLKPIQANCTTRKFVN